MRKSGCVFLAYLVTMMLVLEGNWVRAAPESRTDQLLAALNDLEKLERKYSPMARPRFGKRAQINNNFPAPDYDGQLHNIPPGLRKLFQQYAILHDSVSKWRPGGLAPDPEMRPIRPGNPLEYPQPDPVDNHIGFV